MVTLHTRQIEMFNAINETLGNDIEVVIFAFVNNDESLFLFIT